MLRQSLFAVALVSMTVYLSCKGKIDGPVGGVDYDPQIPDAEELVIDVNTDELVAEEITVTEGSVDNQAAEDLANNTIEQADSTDLANTAAALDQAISTDAKTYWETNESNLEALSADEDDTFIAQVQDAEAKLKANQALLAKYLPNVVAASGGRMLTGARFAGIEANYNDDIARTSNDLCINTWIEWREDQLAPYEDVLDNALATIEGVYNTQKDKLDVSYTTQASNFETTRSNNIAKYKDLHAKAIVKLDDALSAGILSTETHGLLKGLNTIMLAVNLYYVQVNYKNSVSILNESYADALDALEALRTKLEGEATSQFNAAKKVVEDQYNENVAKCHDQGGTHQGTNG